MCSFEVDGLEVGEYWECWESGGTSNSGNVGNVGKVGGNFKLGKMGKIGKLASEFLRTLRISALRISKMVRSGLEPGTFDSEFLCDLRISAFPIFKIARSGLELGPSAKRVRQFNGFLILFVTPDTTYTTSKRRPKLSSAISECCGKPLI